VLVFSMHEETVFAERALALGARGYITKSSAPEVLVEAVQQIAAGRRHFSPDIARRLSGAPRAGALDTLAPREFEIFRLLAEGHSVATIAIRLCLSAKTVANYATQIRSKLDVTSDAELARIAIRSGLLEP
jgi:two-component system, NarL family, invasion response regulator UvrY